MDGRLFLEDPYRRDFDAQVTDSADGWCTLSQTSFYPGGGGQPHDRGHLVVGGAPCEVSAIREDDDGRVWHQVTPPPAVGAAVHGEIDWPFRLGLMRHHALMHIVNTVARDRYGGVITGVQLGPERSRIDFKLAGFERAQLAELEALVNAVIERSLPISSSSVSEEEFRARPELIRTLYVLPPVVDGRVRIVTIAGFDTQACGGTHVHSTGEIGRVRIAKLDNKGRENKRFYWESTAS
jgi:misacylated tRNA(Ala) deacylase